MLNELLDEKTVAEQLKCMFLRDVASKDFFTKEDLLQLSLCHRFSIGTRTTAAQLYMRNGGEVSICSSTNSALLCGAIIESTPRLFEEALRWVISNDFTYDVPVVRAINTAMKNHLEFSCLASEHLDDIQRCLTIMLRVLFCQAKCSDQNNILKDVLMWRDRLGLSYLQQFRWFMSLPPGLKQKYVVLAMLIAELSPEEVFEFEESFCSELWDVVCSQIIASNTGDFMVAWALSVATSSSSRFVPFLIDSLQSLNNLRRGNSARFWLSHLTRCSELAPLLVDAKEILADRLRAGEFVDISWPFCSEELKELSCVDYEWDWREEQEVWSRTDCALFAWIHLFSSSLKFGRKRNIRITESDLEMLDICLESCMPVVRRDALEALITLRTTSVPEDFVRTRFCSFVENNINCDNENVRKCIVKYAAVLRKEGLWVERAMKNLLVKDSNIPRQTLLLELAQSDCVFTDEDDLEALIEMSVGDDSDIRRKAAEVIHSNDGLSDVKLGLVNHHFDHIVFNASDLDRIRDMVCLMFHYCSLENLCDRIRPLEGRSVNVFLRCLLTLFDLDCRAAKLFHDIVPKCISINEEEMLKSGSLYVGQCSTLVELAKRLSFNYDDVMLSGMYSSNLADYHTTLRNSCEIISFLCCSGNVEENLLKRSYESLWNVLMRSRHRGVIDHVSECFLRVTDFCLIQKKAVEHPKILLEKTKKLVSMEECETRDLAFSVVINCLAERLSLFQPTFEYMLFLLKNGSFRTAERVLHIIQSILCCARSDVSANYWNTFCLLLDVFRSEAWMVRGRACHCFSALVCRLVGEYTNGYPLFIFISKNRDFWRGFVEIFTAMDMSDPSLILILSFIARIQVIDQNLYSLNEWRTVEKIRQRLLEILLQCRQMRTAHLIINCLFCFGFRITEKYCKALNKKKHSQNLLHFVNYALLRDDRIRCENVLKTGFDREENILFSSKAGRILSEVMELSLPIYRNSLTVQPKFFTLFVSIERLVLSAKELNRLWASHALVLCSEAVLKRLFDLRLRFFCCSCSLLMDEQYNIRRVTSRLLSFMASRQPYSVSPVICIKDLIRKIINDGVEVNELLQFWREWTSSNSIRRRKFNRYFEDSFIEHLILLSSS